MLDGVDICTTWVAAPALENRGERATLTQIKDMEAHLPFAWLGGREAALYLAKLLVIRLAEASRYVLFLKNQKLVTLLALALRCPCSGMEFRSNGIPILTPNYAENRSKRLEIRHFTSQASRISSPLFSLLFSLSDPCEG
jgi:hypothetical protein